MRFLVGIACVAVIGCSRDPAAPAPGTPEAGIVIPAEELAAQADLRVYPAATTPNSQSNVRESAGEKRIELVMFTPDSPKKVLDYYAKELARADRSANQLIGMTKKGSFVTITVLAEKGKTKVVAVALTGTKK